MAIAGRTTAAKTTPKLVQGKGVVQVPAPTSAKANGATTTVMRTLLENGTAKGEPVAAESIEIHTFVTDTAKASAGATYTRNLGNYESVKIYVGVSIPCYLEEFDTVMAQAIDKAKVKLEEAIEVLQIAPSEGATEVVEAEEAPAEETAAEPEAEDGGIDLEYLKAADLAVLTELAETNAHLEVNADDYPEVEDLRQVLIQAILGEDVLQQYTSELETAGEDGEATDDPYTEESLAAASVDELKAVFEAWQLGGYPKGPAPIAKKAAIKKILERQNG